VSLAGATVLFKSPEKQKVFSTSHEIYSAPKMGLLGCPEIPWNPQPKAKSKMGAVRHLDLIPQRIPYNSA